MGFPRAAFREGFSDPRTTLGGVVLTSQASGSPVVRMVGAQNPMHLGDQLPGHLRPAICTRSLVESQEGAQGVGIGP
ncbi:MAG: hypothetical protein EA421_02720 [Gemmatimonadales bacterium]|nr:MAG: hypothetical protein EA421_02720 [Gemmatimonadales bacterium]